MSLTAQQVKVIKATVPVLQEHGEKISRLFYHDMLTSIPDLNHLFNQANQLNGHQATALASALYAYAANIDDLGQLSPAIERISQKHASLYIQPDQYDIVGTYLLQAMGKVLQEAFTQDICDAWAAAYKQLANVMIAREAQLLKDAGDWKDWRDFTISKKVKESEEITSFYLTPEDERPLPTYLPGQYISVRIDVPALKYLQSRQYSLSEEPRSDHYRVSVKRERGLDVDHPDAPQRPGHISNILHDDKEVGDTIQVSHPAGDFFLDTRKDIKYPVVLISAGVGLTPLLSIIDTLVAKDSHNLISWIHATRRSSVDAMHSHIKEIIHTHQNVHGRVFTKYPSETDRKGEDYDYAGRMHLNKLDKDADLFIGDRSTEYYICGPEKFMIDMEKGLRGFGVGPERIKLEVFGTGALPVT